jgi:hypothetical protein
MSDHQRDFLDDNTSELIDQMIRVAGACPADQVIIAGSRLDLLIGLLRRGFAGVSSIAAGSPVGGEDADILLIPDAGSPEQLRHALPRLLRRLHPGGTAVLHQLPGGSPQGRRELRRALQDFGLATLGELASADGVLLTARKPGALRLGQVA